MRWLKRLRPPHDEWGSRTVYTLILCASGFILGIVAADGELDSSVRLVLAALAVAMFLGAGTLLASMRRDERMAARQERMDGRIDRQIELLESIDSRLGRLGE